MLKFIKLIVAHAEACIEQRVKMFLQNRNCWGDFIIVILINYTKEYVKNKNILPTHLSLIFWNKSILLPPMMMLK